MRLASQHLQDGGSRHFSNLRTELAPRRVAVPRRQLRPCPQLRAASVVSELPPEANSFTNGTGAATPAAEQGPLQRWLNWWALKSPTAEGAAEEAQGVSRSKLLPLLGKIIALVAPEKLMICAATTFMVLAAAAELSIPHFATKCIFSAAAPDATRAAFQGTLYLLTGLVVFYGVMSALRGYCFSILNNRMTKRLRTKLFANLVRRETSFFDATETGSLTSRLQADCQGMTKCVSTNLNIAFRNMLQAVGGVIYLAVTSPVMCGATMVVCAILWAITLFYGDYARRTQKIYQDTLACSSQVAEEVLSLTRVVRTFGTEKQEETRYSGWLGNLYNVGLRQATGYGMFVLTGHITCYMTKVVALTLGCTLMLQGQLTAEQLTNFIFYVEFVTYASLSACDEVVEVMEAVGASERVMTLLESPPAAQVAGGVCPPSFSGRVELRDVSFSYATRPNHMALVDVNLVLQPGQLVALVGLSGSGKTTLVALLQRLYDPTSGAVYLDGQDLRSLDAAWFRSQIGVVNQEPRLFSSTIAANIAYGWPNATQQDIEDAAKAANAHEFISSLPLKYETKVTDRLLSGGQKQRIALARALVRKPKLLVLDEATSALDAESEAQVQSALDAAMRTRDRTVIVIAHRLSTVRNADVTVVMDKGRIVERGTHASLLAQEGIYAKLVSRQQYAREPSSNGMGLVDTPPVRPSGGARYSMAAANGNGNGTASTEDTAFQGMSSGDEMSGSGQHAGSRHLVAVGAEHAVEQEAALAIAAAAAVTAENELASKTLGSQDPIDYLAQGN